MERQVVRSSLRRAAAYIYAATLSIHLRLRFSQNLPHFNPLDLFIMKFTTFASSISLLVLILGAHAQTTTTDDRGGDRGGDRDRGSDDTSSLSGSATILPTTLTTISDDFPTTLCVFPSIPGKYVLTHSL